MIHVKDFKNMAQVILFLILEVKSKDFDTLVIKELVKNGIKQRIQNGQKREWFDGNITQIKKIIIDLYNSLECN